MVDTVEVNHQLSLQLIIVNCQAPDLQFCLFRLSPLVSLYLQSQLIIIVTVVKTDFLICLVGETNQVLICLEALSLVRVVVDQVTNHQAPDLNLPMELHQLQNHLINHHTMPS